MGRLEATTTHSGAVASSQPWSTDPDGYYAGIDAAVRDAGLDAPTLALDLAALEHNIADLTARAAGVPIRLASKSLRVRSIIDDVVARDGFAGVLAYDVAEAQWLATESNIDDVLLGYPSVRRAALADLLADDVALTRVTLLVDDVAQLDVIDSIAVSYTHLTLPTIYSV